MAELFNIAAEDFKIVRFNVIEFFVSTTQCTTKIDG